MKKPTKDRMVRLPADLYDKLVTKARREDLTGAQALRRAVRDYVKHG